LCRRHVVIVIAVAPSVDAMIIHIWRNLKSIIRGDGGFVHRRRRFLVRQAMMVLAIVLVVVVVVWELVKGCNILFYGQGRVMELILKMRMRIMK
jgi:hypothetical protein